MTAVTSRSLPSAIVFDFDGTILDTETSACDAMASLYADHGLILDRDWWASAVGTMIDAWQDALQVLRDSTLVDLEVLRDEVRLRHRNLMLRTRPEPGVEALLADCLLESVPVAVATSAPRAWVERHLGAAGLLSRFAVIVPVEDVANPKPHPEPYLTACSRLEVDPSRAVAIEDSPTGVASAVAAGLYTVAVPSLLTRRFDFDHAHLRLDSLAGTGLAELVEHRARTTGAEPMSQRA